MVNSSVRCDHNGHAGISRQSAGRIAQVKEKMGCLWVYIDQDRDDLERMITLAGERSTFTCEVCGAMPPRNSDGSATMWRCEGCAPE